MPFGLTNAAATFQSAFDVVLSKYKWKACLVYMYYIVIFSKNIKQHLEQVDEILTTLKAAEVPLKFKNS